MTQLPSRSDGQLVVAAIRILEHREQHPPTDEEIAAILGWHEDRTRVIARELEDFGALAAIRSPFEQRYKLQNPLKVENLPSEPSVTDDFAHEIESFDARAVEEQERIEKMLGSDQKSAPKAEETKLQQDFGEFREKKPRDPFAD